MTRALAVDSRRIALDLHALLRDTDPARWRDEFETAARARLEAIQHQLGRLLEANWPDGQMRNVQLRMAEVARLIRDHSPSIEAAPERRREAWMRLRSQLQPAYESLAASLRAWSIHVPSLRPTNYRRNLLHVVAGVSVILLVEYVLVTPVRLLGLAIAGAVWAWSMEIGRRLSPAVNRFLMRIFGPVAHPHEAHRVNSATWYATSLVILAASFEPVAGVVALAVLGVGDPVAAIVGRRWGRTKLIHGRSLEGTLAFFFTGVLAALVVLAVWHPGLSLAVGLAMAFAGSAAGALAELLARRIDDNIAIPVAAAAAAAAALGVFG